MLIFYFSTQRRLRHRQMESKQEGAVSWIFDWGDFDKYHDKFKTVRHHYSNSNCIIIGSLKWGNGNGKMMKGTIGALISLSHEVMKERLLQHVFLFFFFFFLFLLSLFSCHNWNVRKKEILTLERDRHVGWVAHSMKSKQVPV